MSLQLVSGLIVIMGMAGILAFSISAQAGPFTTPGQFSVGADGSANYSIPIQVSSGTAGMIPNLSLSYNSNGGNGILGLGWGLEGLSQITRCGKTIAQDGVRGGINYDANDKFCLDGQRLIAITGTYGADGTEYRAELANFAKIISYGTAGTGPSWFKVWTKGGQIIEYGNTTDSKIEAAGIATVRLWGVNKISDTKGNYLTATYIEDNPNGEAYLSRIDYTGNASSTPALSPYASVQLNYATRTDTTTNYQAGKVIKNTKRITDISTYVGSTLIKDYKLTYANTGAYHVNTSNVADGSVLTQFQECDGQTTPVCQKPIALTWTPGTVSTAVFGTAQTWSGLPAGATITAIGDVNGDGKADVVYLANVSGSSANIYLSFSSGTSFSAGQLIGSESGFCAIDGYSGACVKMIWPLILLKDVNGDGWADLLTNNKVSLSSGAAFGSSQTWLPAGYTIAAAGDVNGDGKADVLYRDATAESSGAWSAPLYLAFSTGTAFSSGVSVATQYVSAFFDKKYWSSLFLADVNGDGLSDILDSATNTTKLSNGLSFLSTQTGQFSAAIPIDYGVALFRVGDINGDGLADVLTPNIGTGITVYAPTTVIPWVSNGNIFSAASVVSPNNTTAMCGYYSGDADGGVSCDGLIYFNDSFIGDIDGDGLGDLILGSSVRLSLSYSPDLLTLISNGLGISTSAVYNKLSATANSAPVYVQDTGSNAAIYPIRDLLPVVPMYVVSSVSTSDGIGGNITTNYSYGGAKVDLNGRGFLGYRTMNTSIADNDSLVKSYYRQDYPYIGLPSSTEKRRLSNNTLLASQQNTYATQALGGTRQFPYVSQTVESSYELDGSLVSTATTSNQYDAYGNVTQISVTSNDGYTKTTTNSYLNDTTNWLLGRLLRSTVTSVSP
jgi:hypothetical protein